MFLCKALFHYLPRTNIMAQFNLRKLHVWQSQPIQRGLPRRCQSINHKRRKIKLG